MKKVTVAVLTAVALVASPAAGADSGKGKSGSEKKAQHQSGKGKSGSEGVGKKRSGKCKKPQRVGFVAAGTPAAMDAASLTLTVTRANRHATAWLAVNAPTFATTGARLRLSEIVDSNGDGLVDF
nr:hypothetical protein [Actinomycetota bacterium]